MSQFKPGQSGNPGGRPPGSQNKLTKHLRASLKNIIDGEIQNLPALLEKLEPKDRVELTIKLMPCRRFSPYHQVLMSRLIWIWSVSKLLVKT